MLKTKITNSTFSNPITANYQKKLSIIIYLSLGTTLISISTYTLYENPFICTPSEIYTEDIVLYCLAVVQGILHLFMDLNLTFIIIGLSLLWSIMNYEKSNYNDYLVFTFFLISSITHWLESFNEEREVNHPIYSFIPMILIALVIALKRIKPQD